MKCPCYCSCNLTPCTCYSDQATSCGAASTSSTLGRQAGGTFGEVIALQDHWQYLDDGRKAQLAQMAMLTRCVQRCLYGRDLPVALLHAVTAIKLVSCVALAVQILITFFSSFALLTARVSGQLDTIR